jgi:hypothetical protein
MKQEDKDKLLEHINQIVELSNKVNTIWISLREQGKYPIGDCLEHIYRNNQQKEECIKIIRNYGTRR